MCLSTPGRVTQLNDALAEVESEGRRGWYNALPQPNVQVGDYVLTHANLIVARLEPEEARQMFAALEETRRLLELEEGALGHENSLDESTD
jgi:hydrogenase assembly chaperone HypC/HupF